MLRLGELIELRIVAMTVAFCFVQLFLFVPETFWERTPHKDRKSKSASVGNSLHQRNLGRESATENHHDELSNEKHPCPGDMTVAPEVGRPALLGTKQVKSTHRVGFLDEEDVDEKAILTDEGAVIEPERSANPDSHSEMTTRPSNISDSAAHWTGLSPIQSSENALFPCDVKKQPITDVSTPTNMDSSGHSAGEAQNSRSNTPTRPSLLRASSTVSSLFAAGVRLTGAQRYTRDLRQRPAKSFTQTLRPWNGRICDDKWFLVALRPFILFAYPAILWSTLVYSLSIGWLIVLSESVSYVYQNRETYNFSSLGTGLVYISPFVGGVLGTAVAGKVSDIIVRFMSRRNDGIYEPEFRLVMGLPVAISTCIGLMGFGWSAAERDKWIVPTVFFGLISFGCALGSTTAITFAVDSYRQYAGEALVTLNFSKSKSWRSSGPRQPLAAYMSC